MRYAIFGILVLYSQYALSEIFVSDNFRVEITSNCSEGNVTCDNVDFIVTLPGFTEKQTYKGSTIHTTCADGISPCRFLGYKFKTTNTQYFIYGAGYIQVLDHENNPLLSELGEWHH